MSTVRRAAIAALVLGLAHAPAVGVPAVAAGAVDVAPSSQIVDRDLLRAFERHGQGAYYDVLVVAEEDVLQRLARGGAYRMRALPIARAWLSEPEILEVAAARGARRIEPNVVYDLADDDADLVSGVADVGSSTLEGYTGAGVKIAVIDGALWSTHPDLAHVARNWRVVSEHGRVGVSRQASGPLRRAGLPADIGYVDDHPTVRDDPTLQQIVGATSTQVFVSSTRGRAHVEIRDATAGDHRVDLPAGVDGTSQGGYDNGHGTAVTGVVAGSGSAAGSVPGAPAGVGRGVAPGAELHFYAGASLDGYGVFLINIVAAYDHILSSGAGIDVVNLSIGEPQKVEDPGCDFVLDAPLNVATAAAYDAGILTVAAFGNGGPDEGSCSEIGAAPYVLSVGATTKGRAVVSVSSRGCRSQDAASDLHDREVRLARWQEARSDPTYRDPDTGGTDCESDLGLFRPGVVAPGLEILTTAAPTVAARRYPTDGLAYMRASGSSQAAPHVTGVAALALEAARRAGHDPGPLELIRLLERTADDRLYEEREAVDGDGQVIDAAAAGTGLVDAAAAVSRARQGRFPQEVRLRDLVTPSETGLQLADSWSIAGAALPGSMLTTARDDTYGWHPVPVERDVTELRVSIPKDQRGRVIVRLYPPGRARSASWVAVNTDPVATSWKDCIVTEPRVLRPEPGTWHVRVDTFSRPDVCDLGPGSAPRTEYAGLTVSLWRSARALPRAMTR